MDHLNGHETKVPQICDSRWWQIGVVHRIDSVGQDEASSRFRCEVGGGLDGAPGLRPEFCDVITVSTKGMTLRAEGWPASSGRRAV
ncbi:hypothetical protein, partial [Brevundimonas vesicularis]|uniref:hypothetical protein n=1 Tax=Brevundimonas vesicularis TaxID=41276 RepID=UPI0028A7D806